MKKRGYILMNIGGTLLLCAVLLMLYNMNLEQRAERATTELLPEIWERIQQNKTSKEKDLENSIIKKDEKIEKEQVTNVTIENNDYMGILSIPVLGIELPVLSEYKYESLKSAPCRYSGGISDRLVIAAHNYKIHFGKIKNLSKGDTIHFTDVEGNEYEYEVEKVTILDATAIDEMVNEDWALTLFTCTYGGQDRVTVRANLVEEK